MLLIDDLLTLLSPIAGFKFVMRTLMRTAEEQWTDDTPLKEQLLELQEKVDSGEITEEEYVREEASILRDIREIQERRQALAEQHQSGQ